MTAQTARTIAPWKLDLIRERAKFMRFQPADIDDAVQEIAIEILEAARDAWLDESANPEERERREASDFLAYCDHNGRYADFHSNRHTFITSLSRNHVSPRTAQTLARHSDIRLTMQTYTHIELADQQAAIAALPAPPRVNAPVGPHGETVTQNVR